MGAAENGEAGWGCYSKLEDHINEMELRLHGWLEM